MYVDQFGEDEVIILIETVVVTQGRFGDGIVGVVKLVGVLLNGGAGEVP